MTTFKHAALLLVVLATMLHAIGLQHGLFRSQSTQGTQWTGTATITEEHYRITVYPDYLDVELDWTFTAGGTEPDSFKNALEIVGNVNFVQKSVVTSMLVWYEGKILKGKLKSNGIARDQYEAVVERDAKAPPPPRDPVLLEMIRDDNYDISIFPVSFGGERKLRIRYIIPGFTVNGALKMGYPHAFTDKATVEIRTGAGVDGYSIESSTLPGPIFTNTDFEKLPATTYSFEAYSSSSALQRISYIVPKPAISGGTSRLYTSEFSTEKFSGSMVHVNLPSPGSLLLKSSLDEDYLVIWRWNHPDILRAYTSQIVSQANSLITFFSALNAASKRGALIISIQGGGTIKFALDRKGSAVYNEMLDYLTSLAAQPVPASMSTSTTKITDAELKVIAENGMAEFKAALEDALQMLSGSTVPKQILLLTAGTAFTTGLDTLKTLLSDKSIRLNQFTSYMGESNALIQQCWPGVMLPTSATAPDTALRVMAYLSNGSMTDSFNVRLASANNGTITISDRFIYSGTPLLPKIVFKVFEGSTVISEFDEIPEVVVAKEPMQYARLVGSLPYTIPLSSTMPSSVASSLGFIDMKYTLLALEEDLLDPAIAANYEDSGVPELLPADIFADAEETTIPVADWLKANPRQILQNSSLYYSRWGGLGGGMILDGGEIMFDIAAPQVKTATGAQPRFANAAAQTITEPVPAAPAPNVVAPVKQVAVVQKAAAALAVVNGKLTIPDGLLSDLAAATGEIVIFDLRGKMVARISLGSVMSTGGLRTINLPALTTGTYLIQVRSGKIAHSVKFVVR